MEQKKQISSIRCMKMLSDINELMQCDNFKGLNGWELEFIQSLNRYDNFDKLSEKQRELLNKIYERL